MEQPGLRSSVTHLGVSCVVGVNCAPALARRIVFAPIAAATWKRAGQPQAGVMTMAFVFSGGASLGAAQAGMLEAVYERSIRPDLFVGTSAGAVNAAFAAFRPATVDTARQLQTVWRGLSRSHVFPANPVRAGLGLIGLANHTVPEGNLRRLVRRHAIGERLEEADIPVHVVCADVQSGEEVLLSEGPLVEAVVASAAIPGVFPMVRWDDRHLIDGGVLNNTPISHAVALGADDVIVLQAIGSHRLASPPRTAMAAGIAAMARAIGRRLEDDIVRYSATARITVLPAPELGPILPTDFGRADDLIDEARQQARGALKHLAVSPHLRRVA